MSPKLFLAGLDLVSGICKRYSKKQKKIIQEKKGKPSMKLRKKRYNKHNGKY
jgi:hypothetical protein